MYLSEKTSFYNAFGGTKFILLIAVKDLQLACWVLECQPKKVPDTFLPIRNTSVLILQQ